MALGLTRPRSPPPPVPSSASCGHQDPRPSGLLPSHVRECLIGHQRDPGRDRQPGRAPYHHPLQPQDSQWWRVLGTGARGIARVWGQELPGVGQHRWSCARPADLPLCPAPGSPWQLRFTAQWGAEDTQEAAGEQQEQQAEDGHGDSPACELLEQETLPKPSQAPETDEDEGFGDWSQKPEPRRQCGDTQETPEDGRDPALGKSLHREQQQAQSRSPSPPMQHACEDQVEDRADQNHAQGHLQGLCLSQPGPSLEHTQAQERENWQPPRTPSPLLVQTTEGRNSPPQSPTTKLRDGTESLSLLVPASSSESKAQPTLPVARIDERLEQYTQAVETAGRAPKLARQPSIELPSMAVASTKNLWETGQVQAQSETKTTSNKDIVAGDLSKRSFWEQRGGPKTSSTVKSTPSGKRYKFVATGHGKYEKVLVDEASAP
ncbi:lymphocyte-specific protein 1 [Ochotona princeps]|uniref:lymphocyte-specific protein 1 n=1 Tax=Ochotona princeps TaxID=9978 RepID=UPI0027145864|nr:lymphocyte-specific protein 1 [Ochotona princeps]